MTDILTWIGTTVSILAALFSLWQALKAKKESEKIKNYIIEKYSNYENAQLRTEINLALQELNKIKYKIFNQLQTTSGGKKFEVIENLIIKTKSQKIYEILEVKNSIDLCTKILNILNANKFKEQISELISCLANISRYIDKTVRSNI
mgnify:CR=1 FL=1